MKIRKQIASITLLFTSFVFMLFLSCQHVKADFYDADLNKIIESTNVEYENKYHEIENKSAVAKVRTRKFIIIIGLNVFVIVALLLMFIRRQHKKYSEK